MGRKSWIYFASGVVFLAIALFADPKYPILTASSVGFGVSFLVVFASDLIEMLSKRKHRRLFEKMFGPGSLSTPGVIILQADLIDELMGRLMGMKPVKDRLNLPKLEFAAGAEPNRLYKARTWVNALDTQGTKIIREKFRDRGVPAPEVLIDHHDNIHYPEGAPYAISMGLGFTGQTRSLINRVFQGLLSIDDTTDKGDAIALSGQLPPMRNDEFEISPNANRNGYHPVFPKDWNLESWLAGKSSSARTEDYAVILRHTEEGHQPPVRFILAGFTEDGTAAAGEYLGQNWERLAKEFLTKDSPGRGDFFVIIKDECNGDGWVRATSNFATLTPEIIRDNYPSIDCVWSRRYPRPARAARTAAGA